MARYIPLQWKDRNIQRPNTFQVVDNPDGTKTLIPKPGTVNEPGTLVNAENLNHIEQGIKDLDVNINDISINTTAIDSSIFSNDVESLTEVKSINGRTLKNEIKNGDFSELSPPWRYWSALYGTVSVTDRTITLTGNEQAQEPHIRQDSIFMSSTDKYYMSVLARVKGDNCRAIRIGNWSTVSYATINNPEKDKWYRLTAIKQGYTNGQFLITHLYSDATSANGKVLEVKEVLCVNLTQMFGAGKEPNQLWCDQSIQWFDGIKSSGEQEANKVLVNSVGKNIFDGEIEPGDIDVNTGLNITSTVRYRSKNYARVKPNTSYSFNRSIASGNIGLRYYDINKKYVGSFFTSQPTFSITTTANCFYIRFIDEANNPTQLIQIEEGTPSTIYEPYKSSKLEVQLKEPLMGLPNGASDEITKSKIVRRVGKMVLNGSENWSLDTVPLTNTLTFAMGHNASKPNSALIADKLSFAILSDYINKDIDGLITKGSASIGVRIDRTKLSTQDVPGFKSFLQAYPVTVYYELATPIEEVFSQLLPIKTFNKGSIVLENIIVPRVELTIPNNMAGRVSNLEDKTLKDILTLFNLNNALEAHKTSGDHDARYYRKNEWSGNTASKYYKLPNGLILQWGTIQGSQLTPAAQYGTSGIYNAAFNVDLPLPMSKIIGGDAWCIEGTSDKWRIWKTTINIGRTSQSLATFNLLGLGNIFSSQTYDWFILGY